ncbi:LOW QUALITY PROTEIN: hypothetical protein PNEG_04336 [Pneumocystis murina B123]|uniref:Uncharacterized protein n=1 Tax=Pneumocystis murina (strain B123) TaxID=1069680 RepID=A0A0W4ZWV8_PNEMU|nr:LOW QUALITY PROTEIN: hypothetical protein PNEG_04336 [Pneumocystis murina B123]KTW32851.1 LOW QUALITY PROTEIN: hypothetical protein PNEG_04336 [Pneumocystis murina B123]
MIKKIKLFYFKLFEYENHNLYNLCKNHFEVMKNRNLKLSMIQYDFTIFLEYWKLLFCENKIKLDVIINNSPKHMEIYYSLWIDIGKLIL